MPLIIAFPLSLAFLATFVALPSIALGFVLQVHMRLQNALIALTVAAFALLACLAGVYGLEKTMTASPTIALYLMLFAPGVALGWYLGTRDAKRSAAREKLA